MSAFFWAAGVIIIVLVVAPLIGWAVSGTRTISVNHDIYTATFGNSGGDLLKVFSLPYANIGGDVAINIGFAWTTPTLMEPSLPLLFTLPTNAKNLLVTNVSSVGITVPGLEGVQYGPNTVAFVLTTNPSQYLTGNNLTVGMNAMLGFLLTYTIV
jgi:hypothetical protein